jgi:phosphoglycerol transferase MdoB-like AlkP superfamily enzyme
VAALLAAGSMALIRWKIGSVYGFVSQSTAFFALFLVSLALTAAFAWHARRDASPNWAVLAIPLFFHVFAGIALCLFPTSNPTLLVAVPAQLLFGLAAYSWPSLDKLLPRSPRAD